MILPVPVFVPVITIDWPVTKPPVFVTLNTPEAEIDVTFKGSIVE